MTKKGVVRIVAVALAVMMPLLSASFAFGVSGETGTKNAPATETKYASPDINELTGHGEEPEELSVSAAATYQEKAWYEYVMYSDHAVASYRLDDDSRIIFFDPYTYTNSMVMDVQFDAATTEFDTMSEYSIAHSLEKTISACAESTYTSTSATQTSGKDTFHTDVENGGYSKTTYNYDEIHSTSGTVKEDTEYKYKSREYDTTSKTVGSSFMSDTGVETDTDGRLSMLGVKINVSEHISIGNSESKTTDHHVEWYQDGVTNTTTYSPDYKTTTTHDYESKIEDHTISSTEGWEQLSARVTKTLGSSSSTSSSWSETERTTVTRTYAATHFASDGITPLPWAIVHYQVQMPMKCCLQVKYSGEWITIKTIYCLLTTVQGTCRAWMQNGQIYYEDWGSGEPVVATDFWSQFTTKENLIKAYNDKLYPVGGEN